MELHPLCTLFPRLAGAEFEALKADIAANGQREPITVHGGFILDGGNRYRACVEAGVEPLLKEFTGENLVSFVLSANLHRRHLTPGQQAAIVASAQDWSRAHGLGGDRKSDQAATLPLDSVADRAAQSGASDRTQRMADKVAKASPELALQVAHGEISLPKALEQLEPRAPAVAAPALAAATAPDAPGANGTAQHPAADADAEDDDALAQLVHDVEALQGERDQLMAKVAELEERVKFLTQDDLAAEADRWKQNFEGLSNRNLDLQSKAREAQLHAKSLGDLVAKIRLALGVESTAEILPALAVRRAA